MNSLGDHRPHAVCVPYPAQGHVGPMMRLAKLLHWRGFHITFVNTEYNYRRLLRSGGPDAVKGLPDFRFEAIPDGLPPSDCDATQDIPTLCDATRKNLLRPLKELLVKLNSNPELPQVTCVISDGDMTFGIEAAKDLGIHQVVFWTASTCSFMGYLHFVELIKRDMVPKGKSFLFDGTGDAPIDWIPGMSNIRLRDMPSFINGNNDELLFDFMGSQAQNCLKSSAILFNTFDELEQEVLDAIVATKFPNIYTVGPLPLMERHTPRYDSKSLRSCLWEEDTYCLEWLDQRAPNSVLYVNYGSVAMMTAEDLTEFARGLADSKQPFLWIIRSDIVKGDSATLPEGFLEEIKDRGLLTSWCAQEQVLAHPSVGAFLTHCGWNSTVETISYGVPVICWPFFADQQTNSRYACTTWGIGMEVNPDVKREEVANLVREMMEGDDGKRMRKKTLDWKKKAEEATDIGGSSYIGFDRLIREALTCGRKLPQSNGFIEISK
ncbi:hypothetical protein K2173_014658 [Erythroxylum novogranatense]|uniref:Glycosyltransferase n=1 Tax=Erythroxylum novogranatense TaxID=1862640 RepID=A0AAV8TF70_9ROSI|nr:hypothetical protein K2173_014658 [Erythroxylum novogranatense]